MQEDQGIAENYKDKQRRIKLYARSAAVRMDQPDKFCPDDLYRRFLADVEAKRERSLDFGDYVACAIRYNRPMQKIMAEECGYQTATFELIRLIQAHYDMRRTSAADAFAEVDEWVVMIWCRGLGLPASARFKDDAPERAWWEVVGEEREDVEAEFLDGWDRVRYNPFLTPLENALERATAYPLAITTGRQRSSGYPRFVSLAGWLQVVRGDDPILLPVQSVADVLKVRAMTVTRYRRWAHADKFIRPTKEHRRPKGGQPGDATEFRFDLSRFPELAALAECGTVDAGRDPGPVEQAAPPAKLPPRTADDLEF